MGSALTTPDVLECPGYVGQIEYAPTPHYDKVPKDLAANLRFRRAITKAGDRSKSERRAIRRMCREDILFDINVFGWVFEPRNARFIPAITDPFQDQTILEILAAIGDHDLVIHKSRDMRASWSCVETVEWCWRWRPYQTFMFVSEKQALVDKKGNPKSLFWKFDFIHSPVRMPEWLVPAIDRTELHAENLDNGSVVDGDSSTDTTGTGDRRLAILFDEFSKVDNGHAMLTSSRDVTQCRIFNFTPQGTGNAAYEIAHNENFRRLRLHWTLDSRKTGGLYYDREGKPRSAWYDKECKRANHPKEIAQELDIDYLGSDFQFFEDAGLDRLTREHVQPAWVLGEPVPDTGGRMLDFKVSPDGPLKLWMHLDAYGRPPMGREYVIAVDVSFGTGGKNSSNSSIAIGDRLTREKVGEMIANDVKPDKWADICSALSWWLAFNGLPSKIIWEANGPGRLFGDRLVELHHPNLYQWQKTDGFVPTQTHKFGWWNTPDEKKSLLGALNKAYREGEFVNRSADSVREARQFIYSKGKIEHSRAKNSPDPSSSGENHGDIVIADALLWKELNGAADEQETKTPVAREGSLKFYEEQEEARRSEADSWIGPVEWEGVAV